MAYEKRHFGVFLFVVVITNFATFSGIWRFFPALFASLTASHLPHDQWLLSFVLAGAAKYWSTDATCFFSTCFFAFLSPWFVRFS